jgi:sirohydrochlorin cobaltochelatase
MYYGISADDTAYGGEAKIGVVAISHGAPMKTWNEKVAKLVAAAKSPYPMETAFFDYDEERTLGKAIKRLQGKGANEILVLHLSPSSYSMHHEELRYRVGLRKDMGIYTEEMGPPLKIDVKKIIVSPCMDEHPLMVNALTDYAKELSQNPSKESLVLIGHGPVEELQNIMWERQLKRIGQKIKARLPFREVVSMTLRNDSADLIRDHVADTLREKVKTLSTQGKVIVVFYVLGPMMVQMETKRILRKIPNLVISKKGMASHPKAVKWIEDIISRGMNQTEPPPVKKTWSHLDYDTDKPVGTHRYGFY